MGYDTGNPHEVTQYLSQVVDSLHGALKDSWGSMPAEHQQALLRGLLEAVDGFEGLARRLSEWGTAGYYASHVPEIAGYAANRWIPVGHVPVWWVEATESTDRASKAASTAGSHAEAEAEAEIVVFLDEYKDWQLEKIQQAAMDLAESLGYGDFSLAEDLQGSIFRRWRGKVRDGLNSDFVTQRLDELERRLSIEAVGRAQAEVDVLKTSNAVNLVASLADVPNAVVRVGALMIIKYVNASGDPVVLLRELTSSEIRALEKNPGIQREPKHALELLAVAVQELPDLDAARADMNEPRPGDS